MMRENRNQSDEIPQHHKILSVYKIYDYQLTTHLTMNEILLHFTTTHTHTFTTWFVRSYTETITVSFDSLRLMEIAVRSLYSMPLSTTEPSLPQDGIVML